MSDNERLQGKLVPVRQMQGESFVEMCQRAKTNPFADLEETHLIIEDKLYKIEAEKLDPYDEITLAHKNIDGSINFFVQFYNGSGDLSEALETAVKGMK